jgi:hypothetical protein
MRATLTLEVEGDGALLDADRFAAGAVKDSDGHFAFCMVDQ